MSTKCIVKKIPSNTIKNMKKYEKIIMSKHRTLIFKNKDTHNRSLKPIGLWFGLGTSWIDWIRSEMPHWEKTNLYKVKTNPKYMLTINDQDKFDKLEKNYGHKNGIGIDWGKVSENYSGITINPYNHTERMSSLWYYGWDVASGCIWDKKAIKSIEKIL